MTIDYADWNTSADHALKAYTQGAALARKAGAGATNSGQAVIGGGFVNLANGITWNQPGWELNIQANLPSGAGTRPFAVLQMFWFDSDNVFPAAQDTRYIALGNGPVNPISTAGYGPAKGDIFQVTLTNLEALNAATITWTLQQTSHLYPKDKWRQDAYAGVAPVTFVNPGGVPGSGILCSANPTINPLASQARLLATWQGDVRVQLDNTAGANGCKITITDAVGDIAPTPSGLIATVAAGTAFREDMPFPAKPMLVTLTNTGGAGTIAPLLNIFTKDD